MEIQKIDSVGANGPSGLTVCLCRGTRPPQLSHRSPLQLGKNLEGWQLIFG